MTSIILTSLAVSCSNEEKSSDIDEVKIQYVLKSKNAEVTRAAYRLLTTEEQHFIWNERIDYIIEHEDLTTAQTTFMNELKADLNNNVFVHNSTDNISLKDKYNNSKLEIFHSIQGFYYFGTLASMVDNGTWSSIANGGQSGKTTFYHSTLILIDSNDGSGCTCNQGSMVNPDCETDCLLIKKQTVVVGSFGFGRVMDICQYIKKL